MNLYIYLSNSHLEFEPILYSYTILRIQYAFIATFFLYSCASDGSVQHLETSSKLKTRKFAYRKTQLIFLSSINIICLNNLALKFTKFWTKILFLRYFRYPDLQICLKTGHDIFGWDCTGHRMMP